MEWAELVPFSFCTYSHCNCSLRKWFVLCCFPFTSRPNQTAEYRKDQSSTAYSPTVIHRIYEALKFSFLILVRKPIKVTENDAEYESVLETMIVSRMGNSINQQTLSCYYLYHTECSPCLCHSHFYFFFIFSWYIFLKQKAQLKKKSNTPLQRVIISHLEMSGFT